MDTLGNIEPKKKKRKKSKLEGAFQQEIRRSLFFYYPDIFYVKIPDGIPVFDKGGTDFLPSKPFDAEFSYRGLHVAMEYKVHKDHNSWPLSNISESQMIGLKSADINKKYGFIFLNERHGRGKKRIDSIYVVHITEIEKLISLGIKSINQNRRRTYYCIEKEKIGENWFWRIDKFISKIIGGIENVRNEFSNSSGEISS